MKIFWQLVYDVLNVLLGRLKWFIAGYEAGAHKSQELRAEAEIEVIKRKALEIENEIRKNNAKRSSLDLARDAFERGSGSGSVPGRESGE